MPSAQRWAGNRCCKGIPQSPTLTPQLTCWSTLDSTVWDRGYLWYRVLYTVTHTFVYMVVYDLEMELVIYLLQHNMQSLKVKYYFFILFLMLIHYLSHSSWTYQVVQNGTRPNPFSTGADYRRQNLNSEFFIHCSWDCPNSLGGVKCSSGGEFYITKTYHFICLWNT